MAHRTGRMSGSPDTCWLPQARLHCPSTFLFCLQSLHLLSGASPLSQPFGVSPKVPVNTEFPLPLSIYSSSPHCPCLEGGHDSGWTESPFLDERTDREGGICKQRTLGTDREAEEGLSLYQIKCCIDHGVLSSSVRVLDLKSRLRSQQSPDNPQSRDPQA